jgi:hypothetical protein
VANGFFTASEFHALQRLTRDVCFFQHVPPPPTYLGRRDHAEYVYERLLQILADIFTGVSLIECVAKIMAYADAHHIDVAEPELDLYCMLFTYPDVVYLLTCA